MPDTLPLAISRHTGEDAWTMHEDLVAVHADARADLLDQPFYTPERYAERLQNYVRAPDFDLVAGRLDGLLIGYAFGGPLPINTAWWNGLDDAADPDVAVETPGRTFAFRELLVRRTHQRRGYAHQLHNELLATRPEQRATLLVRSDNPAKDLYLRWGWTHVGYIRPYPDSPRFEALVKPLR
jgi:ribosomal protein S18 acetylase RimI-like enzyme